VPATAAGLSWFLSNLTTPNENKNTRQTLAYNVAVYRRFSRLCSQHCGRRSQPPSVVPPSGVFDGSLRCLASAPVTPRGSHASFSRRRFYLFATAQGTTVIFAIQKLVDVRYKILRYCFY
jgi:hypothetical protein